MNAPAFCSIRAEHRTVFAHALEQRPMPRTLRPVIEELAGFDFVAQVYTLADEWLCVVLTPAGTRFAERDRITQWWERWSTAASTFSENAVAAPTEDERKRWGRRCRSARERASIAFARAYPFVRGAA